MHGVDLQVRIPIRVERIKNEREEIRLAALDACKRRAFYIPDLIESIACSLIYRSDPHY